MRTAPCRLGLTLVLLACAQAALAQTADAPGTSGVPGQRGHHGRHAGNGTSPGRARKADVKIPAEMWPRLDRGALLCSSLDGLRTRAESLEQDNGPQPLPPGCRPIIQATKVTVLDQVPPGATEVQVDATRELGWTDAWLPDKAPVAPGR